MSKLRIAYIASIAVLAVLVIFAVFRPLATSARTTEVLREQLLKTDEEWIIQCDITNREGRDMQYTIQVESSGNLHRENISIANARSYTYIYHIARNTPGNGRVILAIYKDGADEPFKQTTYHVR